MALLSPSPKFNAFSNAGVLGAGYKLYTYANGGSTTPQTTYQDRAGTVPHANPIILDARGEAKIYLTPGLVYRYVLHTDADVPVWSEDDISAAGNDADAVVWTRSESGSVEQAIADELARVIRPEHFGADATGVELADTAFALCAALGKTITLTVGATYYLSTRVSGITGTHFVCPGGYATIKFKTGTGGFSSTTTSGDKADAAVCGFLFSARDDVGIEGVRFTTDGVAEAVIYPVRVLAGCTEKGARFDRLIFQGMKALSGGLLSLNSIGDGGYVVTNIEARNCGTSSTGWNGGLQITVVEVDNDLVGGVHSYPGYIENVRAYNVLLSGDALTLYGQQTDAVNIAGVSGGTDRKGPTIIGVYADGVGEVVDLFCSHAIVKGIRARNVYNDVVKLVHGAQYNDIEIEAVESCGRSVVVLGSSTASNGNTTAKTQHNTVRIGTAKGLGTYGIGLTGTTAAVYIGGGQDPAIGWPVSNRIEIDNLVADASLDYIVYDGNTADIDAGNEVRLHKLSGSVAVRSIGGAGASSTAFEDNCRLRYTLPSLVRASIGTTEALASTVNEIVPYSTESFDQLSEYNTTTYTFSAKYPGVYRVHAQVRFSADTALADDCDMRINQGASIYARKLTEFTSGSVEQCKEVEGIVRIRAEDIGTTAADLSVWVTVTTPGAVSMLNTASMSFLEIARIG